MPICDIFCHVIDNLGDAGIAVRLARALSGQYGFHVRLFIDDPAPLYKLVPDGLGDQVHVVILPLKGARARMRTKIILPLKGGGVAPEGDGGGDCWNGGIVTPSVTLARDTSPFQGEDYFCAHSRTGPFQGEDYRSADLVIELLGAEVPDDYIATMQARAGGPPVWVRYDYLSAESWVDTAHLKPSPHPKSGLPRTFFYPGFTDRTGGILFSDTLGEAAATGADFPNRILMFSYDQPLVGALAELWAAGSGPVMVDISAGAYLTDCPPSRGALTVNRLPFLPQADFDRRMGTYALAFIRGEDSFSQAVAAGVPVVWHIYPTPDQAHWVKLQAFCDRFTEGMTRDAATAFTDMQRVWNGAGGDIQGVWADFVAHFPEISARARDFGVNIRARGRALQNLVDFYAKNR